MSKIEAVLQTGFATDPRDAEAAAQALVESGMADSVRIGLALPDAMQRPEILSRLIDKRVVYTHSAGVLPLEQSVRREPSKIPSEIISVNPPEPTTKSKLAVGSVHQVLSLVSRVASAELERRPTFGLMSRNGWAVARSMRQHNQLIEQISSFSTREVLQAAAASGAKTGIVSMRDDGLFGGCYNPAELRSHPPRIYELDGGHDDFIFSTERVLGELAELMTGIRVAA